MKLLKVSLMALLIVVTLLSAQSFSQNCFGFTPAVQTISVNQGRIIEFSDVTIPADTVVTDVVLIGGNVRIQGTVTDEVVVLGGDIILESSGKVYDKIIIVGGTVIADEKAVIGKGIYCLGKDLRGLGIITIASAVVFFVWMVNVLFSLLLLLVPTMSDVFLKNRVEILAEKLRYGLFRIGLRGSILVSVSLLLFLALSLYVTIIPVIIIMSGFFLMAFMCSIGGIALAIGDELSKYMVGMPGRREKVICGSLVMVLLVNLPVVGLIGWLALVVVSVGVAIDAIIDTLRSD